MPIIKLDGESVAYTIRHSKRAKRVIVKFSLENGLEVVYPGAMSTPSPESVLIANSDWIKATMKRARDASAKRFRRCYEDGELFLVRGKPYRLERCLSNEGSRATAQFSGNSLEVSIPAGTSHTDREQLRDAVLHFYRQLARDYLPVRVAELAAEHGFAYNQLRIKHQKTRWGSCSAKGNINLNLRLMMTPDEAIDYVIIHELCHLRELNHSRQFWMMVECCCPEYRKWKAWLRQNRAYLIL